MLCRSCGFESPDQSKFCGNCGVSLANLCPNCGSENPSRFKFCGNCGTPLLLAADADQVKTPTRADRAVRTGDLPPGAQSRVVTTEAQRRHLTVMFCDVVGSTALSTQLDPEELRDLMQTYHQECVAVINHFGGYVGKYLGDGLLVYFGYPQAHEDDAARAVRAGLGIVAALEKSNPSLSHPLRARIGIHTGLVVVGEIGSGEYREAQAITGETPNVAARLQETAEPDSVVISPSTYRLVAGLFECRDLGPQMLKGLSAPLVVYQVLREGTAQSRFEVAIDAGLTRLVARTAELGLLQRCWQQAKEGTGQIVLLTGEPGIGKSRLVQAIKEQAVAEGATRLELRCSAYHQNSAFYPVIEHLRRLLQFTAQEPPQAKLDKLERALAAHRFPQSDTFPLFAELLSLPRPAAAPPLTLSPQKQKQRTQEALVAWLIAETAAAPVFCACEDLHWADPSTLELLTLLLDQVSHNRMLVVLAFRPDFIAPWSPNPYLTRLTLSRLDRPHIVAMVNHVTGGKALPAEVVQQIISKTDGVPLFVEELTKMVVESGLLREEADRYELKGPLPPLAIPGTLQDSLMARLDRLSPVKEVAQLGATLGREFSYELLKAVSPLDERILQRELAQLVEAELLYQEGQPPQTKYVFKHALVQDAAYQSLLRSRRQQYHQQIAQVLEERFPDTKEAQPELLAHHYTEAGLVARALPHWSRAGQQALQHSANQEAIAHLSRALELLKTVPESPDRTQSELTLLTTLGVCLAMTKGYAASEVKNTYTRARDLCAHVGETPQLFPVLWGLWVFYFVRGELNTACELGRELLHLALNFNDRALLLEAHLALGAALLRRGELATALEHLQQGVSLYDQDQHRSHAFLYGQDPKVACLSDSAYALWLLGYPDQALQKSNEAVALARQLGHPFTLAFAASFAALLQQFLQDAQTAQERAGATIALAQEQGFPNWLGLATVVHGWALAAQRQTEQGIGELQQGAGLLRAIGAELTRPYCLALLAEVYGNGSQAKEARGLLSEALAAAQEREECWWEPELYRLQGELALHFGPSATGQDEFELTPSDPESSRPDTEVEAEACFLKAMEIARRQRAKSLELRAAMSLSRLRRQQGKVPAARDPLDEIYCWFTEGFKTKDLLDAKAVLTGQ